MLSSIDLVAIDAIYHGLCEFISFTKKCIPTKKGDWNWTYGWTPHRWRNEIKFWKIMQMTWWTNKTVYSEWASCKNKFICRKRSKCLLLTIFLNQVDSCDLDWSDYLFVRNRRPHPPIPILQLLNFGGNFIQYKLWRCILVLYR